MRQITNRTAPWSLGWFGILATLAGCPESGVNPQQWADSNSPSSTQVGGHTPDKPEWDIPDEQQICLDPGQTVTLFTPAMLSDSITGIEWLQVQGPQASIEQADDASVRLTVPETFDQDLVIQARDSGSLSRITFFRLSPECESDSRYRVDLGTGRSVEEGSEVLLQPQIQWGSTSVNDLTYDWLQTNGPNLGPFDPALPQMRFIAPEVDDTTRITIEFAVTDGLLQLHESIAIEVTESITPTSDASGDPGSGQEAPAFSIEADVLQGSAPLSVNFDALTIGTDQSNSCAWLWDFGDSSESVTGSSATHLFSKPGSYPVRLCYLETCGGPTLACHEVTVTVEESEPEELIVHGPAIVLTGETAQFSAEVVYRNGTKLEVTHLADWTLTTGSGLMSLNTGGLYQAPAFGETAETLTIQASYQEGGTRLTSSVDTELVPEVCLNQVTDTDGDGAVACNDSCPNDPEKTRAGACGCGIPDSDIGGDGNPDCHGAHCETSGDTWRSFLLPQEVDSNAVYTIEFDAVPNGTNISAHACVTKRY
jgi:PKD repeat protein